MLAEKKDKIIIFIAVVAIMFAAFAIRFYNFHDWLYFKMDQSRDANLIGNAVKFGPEYLPLLGPRAGATDVESGYLRLGPAFYYFQYFSGKLFNSTNPDVFAYPDLFFSIAVLPLIFLFLRLYFSRRHSLFILVMYAFSFLIIQYSRFAWNPNSLPFFFILSFYGLARFLNEENVRKKIFWISLWSIGIAIGSQLHFFGFFTLLGASGLLLFARYKIWKKEYLRGLFQKNALKKFALYAGTAILFFGLIYAPVIISDVMKKGENAKNFVDALGTKAEKKPLFDKITKAIKENAKYYCVIATSECYAGDLGEYKAPVALTLLIMLGGLLLAFRVAKKEPDGMKKDFLFLLLIWFAVFTILTIPVSFQLRPRFFIVVFAVPFIFLGIIYEFLEKKFGKKAIAASLLITAGVLFYNARGTFAWFKEQAKAQEGGATANRTLILKTKDGVTLGQLERAADYMFERHRPGATLYYYVKPEHVAPIRYLLSQKNDPELNFSPLKINDDPNAQYFGVVPSKRELDPIYEKYKDGNFDILSSGQFGQLKAFELDFTNRSVSADFRFNKESKKSDRLFWKDVFGIKSGKNVPEISGDE